MGASLNSWKRHLIQEILLGNIVELFDSKPLKNLFTFKDSEEEISTEIFEDSKGKKIRILFYKLKQNIYELDFTVNNSSFENPDLNYTVREYSTLLKTVSAAVDQFLVEYRPSGVLLQGVDSNLKVLKNVQFKGQKDRLYGYFISQLQDNDDYFVDRQKDGSTHLVRK